MSEIITAAITGCVTLLGVLLSNRAAQAVTDEKLTELTREVREHNHFARRVPVVEEQIRGMDRRLEQLEQGQRRQRRSRCCPVTRLRRSRTSWRISAAIFSSCSAPFFWKNIC